MGACRIEIVVAAAQRQAVPSQTIAAFEAATETSLGGGR
jgi:hypothetical protein